MTDRTLLHPPGHSRPIGRYSAGVAVDIGAGRVLVAVSGQVATDDEGKTLGVGDPAAQAEVVFQRLSAVLDAAGGSVADLVSVIIYLTDITHFPAISAVRDRVFADSAPASTLVEVSRLADPDHLVEISGTAVVHRTDRESG
ncbi:MAG TPA: RidA family protein [Actinokineospora sp.]|nr:RidA family protein [Actinokineospora sp.]